MRTRKKSKKRITRARARIMENNLMTRFIREIEREEPLDISLKSMLAYQTVTTR